MPEQLSLAPEERIEFRDGAVAVADIDVDLNVRVSESFLRSIKTLGVLEPVILAPQSKDPEGRVTWRVVAGRRRVAAAKKAKLERIPARVPKNLSGWLGEDVLALVENAQRSKTNPVDELLSVQALRKAGKTDAEITRATGLKPQRLKQLAALRSLIRPLLEALAAGDIRESVAMAAAKLPETTQKELASKLKESKKLQLKDVQAARQVERSEARAELPPALFETPATTERSWIESVTVLLDKAAEIAEANRDDVADLIRETRDDAIRMENYTRPVPA